MSDETRGVRGERGQTGATGATGATGEIGATGLAGFPNDELIHDAVVEAVMEDRRQRTLSVRLAYTLLGIGLAVVLLLLWINISKLNDQSKATRALAVRIERESVVRRSQTCTTFESAHRQEVDQLRNTYKYVAQLTPEERKSTLNRFVIQNIPRQEAEAASDSDGLGVTVPDYCDDPNTGLPEPDPVVPKRPKALKGLLPPQKELFNPKPIEGVTGWPR